ncbi:MAG: M14 family metallopeptidase [Rudaea sp.]
MPDVLFDRFYKYDDLTRILKAFADEYSSLIRLESIGKSHEGRDVWVVTVTNFATGSDRDKPALWIDGNIHATELSPSTACLYFIDKLVREYGSNPEVTRCLDTRAYYICPRVNPDGAELALAAKPKFIRSSTRPYPFDEEPVEGLQIEDMDGDGRILQMRIPDPNGAWKAYPPDPRLLVRRDPTETGGRYYRLLPEGRLENYDGVLIHVAPQKEGLDLNRNFPVNWRQEHEQEGAGPYPGSEAEAQNLLQFVVKHPNITGVIAFHTQSGVLLRPYDYVSDEAFPAEDLWTYQKIGQKGTEITGYPNVSVFHDFRYHPKQITTGGFDTWAYDQLGIFAWTVEIWSPQRQAGIKEYKFIDWYREHPLEEDLAMLKWSDQALHGKGYVDWYEFDHPQLGKVDLGGWNGMYAWRNPPPEFLQKEVALFPDWLLWHLLISPRLELVSATSTPLGDHTYRVRLVVQNTGWLPTYISKKGLEKKITRGVVCEITLPEGARLETGKPREELRQLEGRAYEQTFVGGTADNTDDRAKVEWVVKAPRGGTVRLTARHDRAGVVHADVELEESR